VRVGFLVNPVAGMGGRVGLKGTDGKTAEAERLGAVAAAGDRAREAMVHLDRLLRAADRVDSLEILTCAPPMGADALAGTHVRHRVVYTAPPATTAVDTRNACAAFQVEGVLDVVRHDGPFVDCGTPAQYLEANLASSGGASVVGDGAVVAGSIDRCVAGS